MQSDQMFEKIIRIDREICTGCGTCIEACTYGAIHLVDHRAELDNALCNQCELCLDACTFGAITETNKSMPASSTAIRSLTESVRSTVQQSIELPKVGVPELGLKSLAASALAFLGSEVAPRLLDLLMKSIEQRIALPNTTSFTNSASRPRDYSKMRGQRKQIRHRGGKTVIQNTTERR
jgi:ferredoxin